MPTAGPPVHRPWPTIRDDIRAAAIENGLPFEQVLHTCARNALLARMTLNFTPLRPVLIGGRALALHLGAEHRRLGPIELRLDAASMDAVAKKFRKLADDNDYQPDGLEFDSSTITRRDIDRGAADASQFVLMVRADTAETVLRIDVELGARGAFTGMDRLPAPFGLGSGAGCKYDEPVAVFADALERVVRRDALRVPKRSLLDAWLCTQIEPLEDAHEAIWTVCERRGTPFPKEVPWTLTDEFAAGAHAQEQWAWMVAREAPGTTVGIEEAVAAVREALADAMGW